MRAAILHQIPGRAVCLTLFVTALLPVLTWSKPATQSAETVIAFVNVNVIPMDREVVVPRQTVIVRGGRIVAIGTMEAIVVPESATVIDGSNRYLLPGLADMHVHLEGRENFGDAPMFLAYGITTVLNLRGFPKHLTWKREIAEGKLLAPHLYTSGEFVNEPLETTPEEVQREVIRQKNAGYDVIKFHEIVADGRYVTTRGLSRPAYDAMNATARQIGIPLIGHTPDTLGLQAVLDDHQSLAHSGILVALYFVPSKSLSTFGFLSFGSLALMLLLCLILLTAGATSHLRHSGSSLKPEITRASLLSACAVFFIVLWPGYGLLSGSLTLLLAVTTLALLIATLSIAACLFSERTWRSRIGSKPVRAIFTLLAIASIAFSLSLAYWVPVAWRTNDSNLAALADKCKRAGIWVEPTLVIYQNVNRMMEGRSGELLANPIMQYVPPDIGSGWAGIPSYRPPLQARLMGFLFRRTLLLSERTTGAMQRGGVPLMLGTDTFGFPFCVPGKSAHDELHLLVKSGLTPYQALQTATVNPATFLGKENEFGTVSVGKRADLLLVDGNPLQDMNRLEHPLGVMVRGHWLEAETLAQMLELSKAGQ
jgi:Amidohydrolase family